MTENDRQFLVMISKSNPDGTTAQIAGRVLAEIERLRAELAIATKLYAKARRISIDEATDNIRDARLIQSP